MKTSKMVVKESNSIIHSEEIKMLTSAPNLSFCLFGLL